MITLTNERLEAVPKDVFRDFAGSGRSRDLHENLLHALPTMNEVEVGGEASVPGPLRRRMAMAQAPMSTAVDRRAAPRYRSVVSAPLKYRRAKSRPAPARGTSTTRPT